MWVDFIVFTSSNFINSIFGVCVCVCVCVCVIRCRGSQTKRQEAQKWEAASAPAAERPAGLRKWNVNAWIFWTHKITAFHLPFKPLREMSFSWLRDTAEAERKRKRAPEDKSKSGEEEKRKKREDSKGKEAEVKEPEAKKKKQSKDDGSSGSDDEEAGVLSVWIHLTRTNYRRLNCKGSLCLFWFMWCDVIYFHFRKIKAERNSKAQRRTKTAGGGKQMK